MQHHPSVWQSYLRGLTRAQADLARDRELRANVNNALEGRTGIECFDHWTQELRETGYLHNHARMWFASIWIFTLRLPWHLGADFFMQHLLDGDPASNTLGWRWAAGLHTKGKTYLAQASNIAKFTDGRFNPTNQLARTAPALIDTQDHPTIAIRTPHAPAPRHPLLLITHDDGAADIVSRTECSGTLGLQYTTESQSEMVKDFKRHAVVDASARVDHNIALIGADADWVSQIIEAAQKAGTRDVITAQAPIGPVATLLDDAQPRLAREGITLHYHARRYDALTWPHANKGFFKLKKKIPDILHELGLQT